MPAGAEQLDLQTLLRETLVAELALTKVPVLSPGQTLEDAADAMRQAQHGSAVVSDAGRLVGIVTERDILRVVATNEDGLSAPLADCMTRNPQTVSQKAALADVVRWMNRGGYRRLPVVDDAGAPVGVVDVKTVVTFLVEQMPHTIYNQASRRQLTVRRREGA